MQGTDGVRKRRLPHTQPKMKIGNISFTIDKSLTAIHKDRINNIVENQFKYYDDVYATDASCNSTYGTSAIGVVIYQGKNYEPNTIEVRIDNFINNNIAEFLALMVAVDNIHPRPGTDLTPNILIITDSLWSLDRMEGYPRYPHTFEHLVMRYIFSQMQTEIEITFQWVPGHSGVLLNAYADKCAKRAARNDKIYKVIPDIFWNNAIRDQQRKFAVLSANPISNDITIVTNPSPCRFCKNTYSDEKIIHLVLNCSKFTRMRTQLKNTFEEHGIDFTPQLIAKGYGQKYIQNFIREVYRHSPYVPPPMRSRAIKENATLYISTHA